MKTAELEGAALDAAVAKAEWIELIEQDQGGFAAWDSRHACWRGWSACTDWRIAGPIIERENIAIYPRESIFTDGLAYSLEAWVGCIGFRVAKEGFTGDESAVVQYDTIGSGPTPLIAAMRAYVAMKAAP